MAEEGYRQMVAAGVDGLTIYQETYDRDLYAEMHPFGRKRDYAWRLLTPERGGQAGLRRIGLGALLGLGRSAARPFSWACTPAPDPPLLAQPGHRLLSRACALPTAASSP